MIHIGCLNCFVLFSSFYGSLQDPPPRWILPPLPSSDSSSSPFLNPSMPSSVSSPFFPLPPPFLIQLPIRYSILPPFARPMASLLPPTHPPPLLLAFPLISS